VSTTTPDHYHVFAVQGLCHAYECWRAFDDKFTKAEASQHVNDVIGADALGHAGCEDVGISEFGEDRFWDLVSDCVAAGWDDVVSVACSDPCRFDDLFTETVDSAHGWPRVEGSAA